MDLTTQSLTLVRIPSRVVRLRRCALRQTSRDRWLAQTKPRLLLNLLERPPSPLRGFGGIRLRVIAGLPRRSPGKHAAGRSLASPTGTAKGCNVKFGGIAA
jgi:hypothetical protein